MYALIRHKFYIWLMKYKNLMNDDVNMSNINIIFLDFGFIKCICDY